MNLLEIIKGRRSIRRFKSDLIPEDTLNQLKDALIWAPSAGNLQSRRFYFVFNREVKERLSGAALNQHFIAEAPLSIVCCADMRIERFYGSRGRDLYALQDVAASIQNLMLLAHSLGLGSVWVGAFHEDEVSKIMNLPSYLRPVAIVPVGYPLENPSPPPRVKRDEAIEDVR